VFGTETRNGLDGPVIESQ